MKKYSLKRIGNLVLCGLLGATILLAGCSEKKTNAAKPEDAKPEIKVEQKVSSARNTPIVAAVKKVGSAVVSIKVKATAVDFFGRQFEQQGAGSGVIYDANGLIVTNNHVVEGAKELLVNLNDGRSFKARLLGADAKSDLAVIKIDAKDLNVAKFGDSDDLQIGEPAIAIGNPMGMEGSVSVGVISALKRTVTIGDKQMKLIQTDAAINPGNSGGALCNADGEVVGINSLKMGASGVEGLGFAIPINEAKPIIDQLAASGHVSRPYLGVYLMDKEAMQRQGLEMDLHGGVLLAKIVPGSGAAKAGLIGGDIVLEVNGKKVTTAKEIRDVIEKCKVGEKVELVIMHNGARVNRTVTLGEVPQEN